MSDNGPVALMHVADLHSNSTVALCPAAVNLDDGGTYHASRGQRWLWDSWVSLWDKAEYAAPAGYKRVLLLNGDLGELDTKKRSVQLISLNKATIQNIIIDNLAPALAWADAVYVMRGTAAHTGKSEWLEEWLANDIGAVRASKEAASWYHLRSVAGGVRVDAAHHSGVGGDSKTQAIRLEKKTLMLYQARMQPWPNLVLRAHNHQYSDSGRNFHREGITAYISRAWVLMNEYGYRQGWENSLADIGAQMFLCSGGRYDVIDYEYQPPGEKRIWQATF